MTTMHAAKRARTAAKKARRWRNLYFTRSYGTFWGILIHPTEAAAVASSRDSFAGWARGCRDRRNPFITLDCGTTFRVKQFLFAIPIPLET